MDRREFMGQAAGMLGGLVVGGCLSSKGRGVVKAKRPNILYIMADDHTSQAIGCYGSKMNQTPNIDRIAKEGMRLDDCFCTNSICAPSRAVILTGKYSHKNGLVNNWSKFDGSQVTLPKLLRQSGYETAMIGKWHLKSDPTGFDYWSVLDGQGRYFDPVFIEMGEQKVIKGYATDIITDKTLNWLDHRDQEKPFFVMCHHKAPHSPWKPPKRYEQLFADRDIPAPPTFDDDYATRCEAARDCDMAIENWIDIQYKEDDPRRHPPAGLSGEALKFWKYQQYIKSYLRCVQCVDENVGRLLDYLDRKGLTDDTIVIYTSDQGFYLGEHGWYDKRFMYEQSLHMPFLVRYPRAIKAGSVSDAMTLNIDFAPTLLDYAGAAIPKEIQGRSFRKVLEGKTPSDWRTSMYYHYYEYPGYHMVKRHYGIRTKRYKLIHFYDDIDAWELYDLQNDPYELKNMYGQPGTEALVKRLKRQLVKLQKQYGDSDELAHEFIKRYPGHMPGYRKRLMKKNKNKN